MCAQACPLAALGARPSSALKSRPADYDQSSHFDGENLAIQAFINGRVPKWQGGALGMRRLPWFAI